MPIVLVRVTPTAKRNSYRVAILVGALTQGSVLRPQPWAGEKQLRQSCQGCAPFSDVYGHIYLGGNGLTMMMICTQWWNGVWCASNDGLAHRGWYAPLATLTELRFHSPGLRGEAPLPWVQFTTNQCYSERVAFSRRRYLLQAII